MSGAELYIGQPWPGGIYTLLVTVNSHTHTAPTSIANGSHQQIHGLFLRHGTVSGALAAS